MPRESSINMVITREPNITDEMRRQGVFERIARDRRKAEGTDEQRRNKDYPFTLICLYCGYDYDGCYINQPCPIYRNHSTGQIRYILKDEFVSKIPNPDDCTIENSKIETIFGYTLS